MNSVARSLDRTLPNSHLPLRYYTGHQSWTLENLCVDSFHNDIPYFTTRWDALCPYINVTDEMMTTAPKPLIVYAVPPDSRYGVPINDEYGMSDVLAEDFWTDERRKRKFAEMDKAFRQFTTSFTLMEPGTVSSEFLFEIGGEHFEKYGIDPREIDGFVDYVRDLKTLVIRVHDAQGTLVLTDVSIIMPEYNQVYGSFCQWDYAFKNRSPGIYACLLAARWTYENGYRYYNMGPVGDYPYKSLFVNHLEQIYGIALAHPDHPLSQDPTSPLYTDFRAGDVNRILRQIPNRRRARLRVLDSVPAAAHAIP